MSNSGGDLNNSTAIEGGTDGTIIGNSGSSLRVNLTGGAVFGVGGAESIDVLTVQGISTGTPVRTQICAGSTNAAVKAASTAALATDPSLVVALSPNSALPTGANTIGSVSNISGTVSLPTGASTAARQDTGNASLASLDTKTPGLGQAVMAASTPVVLASNQTAISVSGEITATGANLEATQLLIYAETVAMRENSEMALLLQIQSYQTSLAGNRGYEIR